MDEYLFCGNLVARHLLYECVELLCVVRKKILYEEIFLVGSNLLPSVWVGTKLSLVESDPDIYPFLGLCRPYSYHH